MRKWRAMGGIRFGGVRGIEAAPLRRANYSKQIFTGAWGGRRGEPMNEWTRFSLTYGGEGNCNGYMPMGVSQLGWAEGLVSTRSISAGQAEL